MPIFSHCFHFLFRFQTIHGDVYVPSMRMSWIFRWLSPLSVPLHVLSCRFKLTFTSTQGYVVCIVAQLLALLTWVGGVKCRFYCFIDVLFPVVPRPHFFQHLCVAPTTYCDSNQSRYMYNIINIVFTSQWKCSTRLWSFEGLFEKTK